MDSIIKLLSSPEQASLVMQNLASYIIYVYPGIISIYLYNFFNAKTTHNTQAFIVKSFAISYLYNVFLGEICPKVNVGINSIKYNLILIVISFIIPYFWQQFRLSSLFEKICGIFKIATSVTDVPFELLEDKEEKYTCLKIYLKDDPHVYIGYISEYEYESKNDKYIIVSGYKKYFVDENLNEKLLVDNKKERYDEKVYIKLENIKLIEKISEKRADEEIYKAKE